MTSTDRMKKITTWMTAVILLSLLAGCSIAPQHSTEVVMLPTAYSVDAAPAPVTSQQQLTRSLFEQYQDWRGTHYQPGGLSKAGIDCSGYVYMTFKDRFGMEMPRSTLGQVQLGNPVTRNDLRTGDLVFFHTGKRTTHVGIYLNDDQFMHASSSKGVMISDLRESYWSHAWWTARRVRSDYLDLLAQR